MLWIMKLPRIIWIPPRFNLAIILSGLAFLVTLILLLSSSSESYTGYISHNVRILTGINPDFEEDYSILEAREEFYPRWLPSNDSWGLGHVDMTSWMVTQAYRRHLVEASCPDMTSQTRLELLMDELSHFQTDSLYVDTKHKVLYCAIPKVACSSWKSILAFLTGDPAVNGSRPDRIPDVHDNGFMRKIGLTQLRDYSFKEATFIVNNYKKFLMVRHPLERLVSAYREKFVKEDKWTKGFHKKFGRRIIRLYRQDPSVESLQKGSDVTFPEFINFLIDPNVQEKYKWNPHWATYQDLCLPCHMNYDFILKYDSFDTDADMVLRQLYRVNNSIDLFPKRNAQKVNSKHKMHELRETISDSMLKQIAKIYRKDFKMFGYLLNEDEYIV